MTVYFRTCRLFVARVGQELAELRPTHPGTGHKLNVSKDIGWTKRAGSRPAIEPKGWCTPSLHEYGKHSTALNPYTNPSSHHLQPWPRYARALVFKVGSGAHADRGDNKQIPWRTNGALAGK